MNAFLRKLQNDFELYDLEIFNFNRLSGHYKASFETFIYFDYSYSKFKGRVSKQINVKHNETYKQAILRTIEQIESSK